jgi:nickel/cobalt exporter
MRVLAILLLTLALFLSLTPPLRADPLTDRSARPEASLADGFPLGRGIVMRLATLQRGLNDSISAAFRDVRENGSRTAIALILGLAFLYGVLHAVGPGHGKAVVASYFVSNPAHWSSGIVMGSLISLIQGVSAIALVGLLAVVLQWRQFDVLNQATLAELVSYGLIATLGAVMLYRAVTGQGCAHNHGDAHTHSDDTHRESASRAPYHSGAAALDLRLVIATGLTPCASAIIILLFALANESLWVGIAAVSALSIGMAITVSIIGVASVFGRRALLSLLGSIGVQSHRFERGLSILGALTIIAASALLMAGAWFRL